MITFDEWVEKYQPIEGFNSQTDCIDNLTIFNLAKEKGINYVWSIISAENEEQYIIPGLAIVNREGYVLCEKPWTLEEEFTLQINDNEMCTIEEAIDYCISFGETQFKIGLDRYNVGTYFNEHLDPTFNGEMTVNRAKYTAIGYYEDALSVEADDFDDEIHDYYSQLK